MKEKCMLNIKSKEWGKKQLFSSVSLLLALIPRRDWRKCWEDKISVWAQLNDDSAAEKGFNGGWLCGEGEKIADELCKFLNKKHLIALKEREGPSCVHIGDFSEHKQALCHSSHWPCQIMPSEVMYGKAGCHRGLAHLGRGFLNLSMHARSHLQWRIWIHWKMQGERSESTSCGGNLAGTGGSSEPLCKQRDGWLWSGPPACWLICAWCLNVWNL